MKLTRTTKNIALAAVLSSGIALAATQCAVAQDQADPQAPTKDPGYRQLDPQMVKNSETFLAGTVEQRKQLAEKQAIMQALMAADSPDSAKAGQVAGELFDLREQLRVKAQEAGLPYPMLGMGLGRGMGGMGCGFDAGQGPGDGKGAKHHHRR